MKIFNYVSVFLLLTTSYSFSQIVGPGGESGNLTHWFKADVGITLDGTLTHVVGWDDQTPGSSGINNAALSVNATANFPTIEANKHNYNSSLLFTDGLLGYLEMELGDIRNSNYNIIAITERNSTNNFNNHVGTDASSDNDGLNFGYRSGGTNGFFLNQKGNPDSAVQATFPAYDPATEVAILSRATFDNSTGKVVNVISNGKEYNGTSTNVDALIGNGVGYIGRGDNSNGGLKGYISELIIFNDELSTRRIRKIQSYLAIKYGITLDNTGGGVKGDYSDSNDGRMWNANQNISFIRYHNNIIGIGKDEASGLDQEKSTEVRTETSLTIEATTAIDDLDFLLVGNDNGAVNFVPSDNTNFLRRIERTWIAKITESDGSTRTIASPSPTSFTTLNVSITLPTGGSVDPTDYALLIEPSSDPWIFDAAAATEITGGTLVGNVLTFTGVTLNHDDIFTVGLKATSSPGRVSDDLTHWFRADEGIVEDGSTGNIASWTDQYILDGNADNATQSGTAIVLPTTKHNFNPSIEFVDGQFGFFDVDLDEINNSEYNIIAIVERSSTVNNNNFIGTITDPVTTNEGLSVGVRNDRYRLDQRSNGIITPFYPVFVDDATEEATLVRAGLQSQRIISALSAGTEFMTSNSGDLTQLTGNNPGRLGQGERVVRGFQGFMSEMIIYNASIDDDELKRIESYLAIKYGLTLASTDGDYVDSEGKVIWDATANSVYHNDVAGIGKDDVSTLNQKQSQSASPDDILTISIGSTVETTNSANGGVFDNNGDYLIWGNNDPTNTFSLIDHSSLEKVCFKQLNRTWKASNTGDITDLTLQFDLAGLGLGTDFDLVVGENGDFTSGTITTYTATVSVDVLTFGTVALPHGSVFTLVEKTRTTEVTYEAGVWTGGSGASSELNTSDGDKSVTIKDNVALTGSANCRCLIIESGAVLTIETENFLDVENGIELAGDLFLKGTSELIQTTVGNGNPGGAGGTVSKILNEATSSVFRYNYFTSPVHRASDSLFTIGGNLKINDGSFAGNTNPGFTSDDLEGFGTTFSTRWFHTLNNESAFLEIDETAEMGQGVGFTMKGTSTANAYNLIGMPNNGPINVAITADKYLLTGNPYPSTIDLDVFDAVNGASGTSSYDGSVYLWDQPGDEGDHGAGLTDNSGGYATYANGVGATRATITSGSASVLPGEPTALSEITQFIKPGQGFIVYRPDDGEGDKTISFTNAMRDGITFDGTRHFFKTNETKTLNAVKPIVRLGFEYDTDSNEIFHRQLVTVLEGGTLEKDNGKDAFMFDYNSNDAYLIVENQESRYVITSVPTVSEDLELPIGVVLDSEREVTFKIDDVEDFTNDIYLLDKQTETVNKISTTETYQATVNSGDTKDRFSLVFSENTLLGTEFIDDVTKTILYIENQIVHVILESGKVEEISVYNLIGKTVASKINTTSANNMTIDLSNSLGQLLVVKVRTSEGVFTKKIIVN